MREAVIIVFMVTAWLCLLGAVLIEFRPDPPTDLEQWEEELHD